jgi:hypothetical protein
MATTERKSTVMKTVCAIRTLHDERELVIVCAPDAPPTFAVLSVRLAAPGADTDPRVVAFGLADPDEARAAALAHARAVANAERARTGFDTCIDFRNGCPEWREAMGLPRQDELDELLTTDLPD